MYKKIDQKSSKLLIYNIYTTIDSYLLSLGFQLYFTTLYLKCLVKAFPHLATNEPTPTSVKSAVYRHRPVAFSLHCRKIPLSPQRTVSIYQRSPEQYLTSHI